MRFTLFSIVFITSVFCFSQNELSGFYQVGKKDHGKLMTELETGDQIYVIQKPVFELNEVSVVQSGSIGFDGKISLLFELVASGSEKLRIFSKNNPASQLALVLEDKVISNAWVHNEITGGRFELSGFNIKKSKAVKHKIDQLTGKIPIFLKEKFKVYKNRAEYKGEARYSSQTDYEVFMAKEATDDSDCELNYSSNYYLLSLVGNFYSYEYNKSSESACGPMDSTLGLRSIDYTTGHEVNVLDFFNEDDFVTVFKKDTWVVERASSFKIDLSVIKSFDHILHFFKADLGLVALPNSFCFTGFEKGIAKFRFVALEYMGYNHSRHLQLGFELPVKKEMLPFFEESSNFYLGKYKNGLVRIADNH